MSAPRCIALQITADAAFLHVRSGGAAETLTVPLQGDGSPHTILVAVLASLRSYPPTGRMPFPVFRRLQSCRVWRLVLPWGVYRTVDRPAKWRASMTGELVEALGAVSPVPLKELVVSSLPVSPNHVLLAGAPAEEVAAWCDAGDELGIEWEAIWTAPTALVEWALENPTQLSSGWRWTDGTISVEVGTGGNDVSFPDGVHVRAVDEPAGSTLPEAPFRERPGDAAEVPLTAWPVEAAAKIRLIDPSESLSLARKEFGARGLSRRRQRPLALAAFLLTMACILWALGSHLRLNAYAQETQYQTSAVNAAYTSVFGAGARSATPLAALDQQVAAWQNLRQRMALVAEGPSALERLTAVLGGIPADLPITVQSLRTHQRELWLDGLVRSQAEARRLEDALQGLPHCKSDPIRTTATEGGFVRFSLHLSL